MRNLESSTAFDEKEGWRLKTVLSLDYGSLRVAENISTDLQIGEEVEIMWHELPVRIAVPEGDNCMHGRAKGLIMGGDLYKIKLTRIGAV
jgi:hypothetical protein